MLGYKITKNLKRGFGLIEVMTAIAIIIIVVGAAGSAARQAIKIANSNTDQLVAEGVAQSILEKYKASVGGEKLNINDGTTGTVKINNIDYKYEINVETRPSPNNKEYYEVVSTVNWQGDKDQKVQKFSLGTIIAKE
jgi:prepilin-type N-terminal cleavage/methylation domain-containing protein